MRRRVRTWVGEIDKMLYGGIPEGNQVVLAGGPGVGKTLTSFEFLYKNALNDNIGVFISLEETADIILENAKEAFGEFTEIDKLITDKKLFVYGLEELNQYLDSGKDSGGYVFTSLVGVIRNLIETTKANRLVIDSSSILQLLIKDQLEYKITTLKLVAMLRKLNVTSILTLEMGAYERGELKFIPEFFIFDGILVMFSGEGKGDKTLALEVMKMRGTRHSFLTLPYEITPSGINILVPKGTEDEL